jgi:predicted RNase H-like nuclease (RuvC/YqgF family)
VRKALPKMGKNTKKNVILDILCKLQPKTPYLSKKLAEADKSGKVNSTSIGLSLAQSRSTMEIEERGTIIIPITAESPRIAVKPRRITPRDDRLRQLALERDQLRRDIARLSDRIRRLCEEIEWEAQWWQRGLDAGFQRESIDGVRRRISRLRGSLEYQGLVGNLTEF